MTIQSMTGFGSSETEQPTGTYKLEVKSVNNRYMNVQFRSPRLFNSLETDLRKYLSDRLERGSVSVFLNHSLPEDDLTIDSNSALAGKYVNALRSIAREFSLSGDVAVSDLSPFYKEFIEHDAAEFERDELWRDLRAALDVALDALIAEQVREGRFIAGDLQKILASIETHMKRIEDRAPQRLAAYREKLRSTVGDLLENSQEPDDRLNVEIALMAEKLDIAEEITRMHAHTAAMKTLLSEGGTVGKRMNFILQEMNREVNTIGSKANSSEISEEVVCLKELVEKIREQSLNII
ncbi:MAG: YicC/YloC family endoribonuclease [Fibrobacterota bacterium]